MGIEEIRKLKGEADIPKPEKVYRIPKVSKKKLAKMAAESEAGTDSALDKWFESRRKLMTGRCFFCGGKTEKLNDETYRRSIAHLLPKRKNMFASIATHEDNWMELCFFGESCHTNFDNGMISWDFLRDSKEWKIIVSKFLRIYPYIIEEERRNIPPLLMREIKK